MLVASFRASSTAAARQDWRSMSARSGTGLCGVSLAWRSPKSRVKESKGRSRMCCILVARRLLVFWPFANEKTVRASWGHKSTEPSRFLASGSADSGGPIPMPRSESGLGSNTRGQARCFSCENAQYTIPSACRSSTLQLQLLLLPSSYD